MAEKPQSKAVRPSPRSAPSQAPGRNAAPPVTISGRWLAWALFFALSLAVISAYATLALLFYQGQWQLVLHPAKTITITPASQGLKFDEIHFDYTETGSAQLDGWWIPAEKDTRWSGSTLLYLHDGTGSLSDYRDDLATLHSLGINVFAFDYRGFGHSAGPTPREKRMNEDADAAWTYLTDTRNIDAKFIVLYGAGVGASLAAELAARHAPAGVILDRPSEQARQIIAADARARLFPQWLIIERFDPSETLKNLIVPKLFLDRSGKKSRTEQLYQSAAFPKEYFELKPGAYEATLRRFFDEILP